MKRAALIVSLAAVWTVVASAFFCAFDFRLFRFPYAQWWVGLYYLPHMLWLPRLSVSAISRWPILWFIVGFLVATLWVVILARALIGKRKERQPALYGTSKLADQSAMRSGGITTEKRT